MTPPGRTLYFAYGSNMSRAQMAQRCPGAEAVDIGELDGWHFVIMARGPATIVPRPGGRVLGVVWACTDEHLDTLDRFEGVHDGRYRREHPPVRLRSTGETLPILTYVEHADALGDPYPGYLERILEGADEHGIDHDYVETLRTWAAKA